MIWKTLWCTSDGLWSKINNPHEMIHWPCCVPVQELVKKEISDWILYIAIYKCQDLSHSVARGKWMEMSASLSWLFAGLHMYPLDILKSILIILVLPILISLSSLIWLRCMGKLQWTEIHQLNKRIGPSDSIDCCENSTTSLVSIIVLSFLPFKL